MQSRYLSLISSAVAVIGLTATEPAAHAATCADTLTSNPQLTRFTNLVQLSGLAPQLATNTLTVFAPTNAALNDISSVTQMLAGQSSNSSPDFPKLQILVRARLVSGPHPENDMHGKIVLPTLAGISLTVDGTGARAIVLSACALSGVNLSGTHVMSDVHVAGPAIACDSGIIYPVDNALLY